MDHAEVAVRTGGVERVIERVSRHEEAAVEVVTTVEVMVGVVELEKDTTPAIGSVQFTRRPDRTPSTVGVLN